MALKTLKRLVLFTSFLSACAQVPDPAKEIADDALDNIGCENAQSRLWDSLYRIAEQGNQLPDSQSLKGRLLSQGKKRGLRDSRFDRYAEEFIRQYRVIESSTLRASQNPDPQELVKALVALETGDTSTEELTISRDQLRELRQRVNSAQADLGKDCKQPEPAPPAPAPPAAPIPIPAPLPPATLPPAAEPANFFDELKKNLSPEVFGARKTVTTAYQSCEILGLRAMTGADPAVQGITITGNHPAGGYNREITSLASVQRTHFYLHQVRQEQGAACHDIMRSPLIYDFGGKPFASSSNHFLLDLFTNAGSGTRVLGVDCSGYVFTALAAGGLKLDPDTEMKAIHVMNIPARRYMRPEDGMRCFEHVRMTQSSSLQPGDLAASTGHIIMVDEVGADPFGLASIRSASGCTTANISPDRFNFVISQSSPSKGGIGINRMQARDYFRESSTYRNGFIQFALGACRAKFGTVNTPRDPNLALVRHKKTSNCSVRPFSLQKESCLYLCPAI
jgi:cell wall-associated NlpC family hydrolase